MKPTRKASVLDALLSAIVASYPQDVPTPGIAVAKLQAGYYASVRRYSSFGDAMQKGGRIVASVSGHKTAEEAIAALAKRFHDKAAPSPIYDAFKVLKGALK